jgi:hypothetical protein
MNDLLRHSFVFVAATLLSFPLTVSSVTETGSSCLGNFGLRSQPPAAS